MPEYLHPGVYIEEIESGPRPIEGVATSTAAFLGETERGPLRPRLVTGYNEYVRWFGGVFALDKFMPHAVKGFFENGGKRAFICQIVNKPSTVATAYFNDLKVVAVGAGSWGNQVFVEIKASTARIPDPDNPGQSIPMGIRVQAAYWHSLPEGFVPFKPVRQSTAVAATVASRGFRRSFVKRGFSRFLQETCQRHFHSRRAGLHPGASAAAQRTTFCWRDAERRRRNSWPPRQY